MARVGVLIPFRLKSDQQLEWLIAAIKSVEAQKYTDWRLILVNDHSEADITLLKKYLQTLPREKFHAFTSDMNGVSSARNYGVRRASSEIELIMPLDADDLLPVDSLDVQVRAWDAEGHKHGIVFGDIKTFGDDWSRIIETGPYDFRELLHGSYMLVGCLHSRKSWEKVGGWKHEMDNGLEDWEYWVAMGEIGICGYHVPQVTYEYRKHSEGRLAWLRSDETRFQAAIQKMRSLHDNVYKGRYPMGCCGKGSKLAPSASSANVTVDDGRRIDVIYYGNQKASFFVKGRVTGTLYKIPGTGKHLMTQDGLLGVFQADLKFILSMGGNSVFQRT